MFGEGAREGEAVLRQSSEPARPAGSPGRILRPQAALAVPEPARETVERGRKVAAVCAEGEAEQRADAHSCRTRQGWQVSQRHAVARYADPAQNMVARGSPPGRDVPGRLVVSGPESGQADQHAPTRPRGWVSRPAADDRSGPWWR